MLGFSTGCLYKSELNIIEVINLIKVVEQDAIELNFGRVEELMKLSQSDFDIIKIALVGFKNISIHAPFRDIKYDNSSVNLLIKLQKLATEIDANYVVFHPDTVVDGTVIERILDLRAAIENMDKNKIVGKSVVDLAPLFQAMPSAKFVLDLNHVFTVDPSMKLVNDFFNKYQKKIISYHISGYGGEDALHIGLLKNMEILKAIPDRSILSIHEGAIDNLQQMKIEYKLINNLIT